MMITTFFFDTYICTTLRLDLLVLHFRYIQTCSDISVHYTVLLFLHAWCNPLSPLLEWNLVHLDGLVRVLFLPRAPTKFADDMTLLVLTSQNVLVSHESLEPHRSARMDPSSADPHLSTKSVTKTVSEARARVDEHARRIDAADECVDGIGGLGDDAVGVMRAVHVDVRDGEHEGRYGAYGERQ